MWSDRRSPGWWAAVVSASAMSTLVHGCGMAIIASPAGQVPPSPPTVSCADARDQVAQIRGQAFVARRAGRDVPKISITAFDGTDLRATTVQADGSYCVPLARSTEGTFVSVFATAAEMVPQVRNVRIPPRNQDTKLAQVAVEPITLQWARNRDQGHLIGVAYIRVTGGRPVWRDGILSYDPRLDISISGRQTTKIRTDGSGAFVVPLAPGTYEVVTGRNVLEKVEVTRGATTIRPVFSGERTVS